MKTLETMTDTQIAPRKPVVKKPPKKRESPFFHSRPLLFSNRTNSAASSTSTSSAWEFRGNCVPVPQLFPPHINLAAHAANQRCFVLGGPVVDGVVPNTCAVLRRQPTS